MHAFHTEGKKVSEMGSTSEQRKKKGKKEMSSYMISLKFGKQFVISISL